MLKRAPSLTELAKSQIKERILNEEFAEGRIPSEMELASELGVSRTTIRDALSRLELEGTIYRKQGAGTFVNEAGLQ
ncbi:MAG: winged helix-turn-helix transcriptional regulator, partial [Anaerolineae bacterium]|nr:winged helix-turn-helix transcriptional regulator [Anaerolineae bacterium]